MGFLSVSDFLGLSPRSHHIFSAFGDGDGSGDDSPNRGGSGEQKRVAENKSESKQKETNGRPWSRGCRSLRCRGKETYKALDMEETIEEKNNGCNLGAKIPESPKTQHPHHEQRRRWNTRTSSAHKTISPFHGQTGRQSSTSAPRSHAKSTRMLAVCRDILSALRFAVDACSSGARSNSWLGRRHKPNAYAGVFPVAVPGKTSTGRYFCRPLGQANPIRSIGLSDCLSLRFPHYRGSVVSAGRRTHTHPG